MQLLLSGHWTEIDANTESVPQLTGTIQHPPVNTKILYADHFIDVIL